LLTLSIAPRVLVSGGAGFIGSHLCGTLLKNGASVDCIDNLSTGRMSNIAQILNTKGFRFIHGDITDPTSFSRLTSAGYSEVYHLACPTGVPNIHLLGEEMMLACSMGTLHMLKIAQRSQAKFLYASTAEIYGDPQIFPQPETYSGNVDPTGPRGPYEEGKRFGEALTAFYVKKIGLNARIVRIFNTYGARMSPEDKRLVPQMFESALSNRPFTIYGDGSQTRSLLHVDDLISGFLVAMENGRPGDVFNIGGDVEATVLDLFRQFQSITGWALDPLFREHFIQDHGRRCPDTSRIRRLGWSQKIPMDVGLARSYGEISRERTLSSLPVPAKRCRTSRARPGSHRPRSHQEQRPARFG